MYPTKTTKKFDLNTLVVERMFPVHPSFVWDAWSKSEKLEQWWAPAPWKAITRSFDFSEGGHWYYYMSGPNGEKVWAWFGYLTLETNNMFIAENYFCNEIGLKQKTEPMMIWRGEFQNLDSQTHLKITIQGKVAGDAEKLVEKGFEQGITTALNNLEALLLDN